MYCATRKAEIFTIFVHILGETMTSKIHSEIYCPLSIRTIGLFRFFIVIKF